MDIEDLILKIHTAPLEPTGWAAVAQDLVQLCRAERAVILRMGLIPTSQPWVLPLEFDPGTLQEYASYWFAHDLFYRGALQQRRMAPGLVSTGEQLIDRKAYLSSAYFNDYLKRYDIERQANVCLTDPQPDLGLGPAALALYRGVGKEPFSDEHTSVLRRVAPHLSIAARTTWHIEALALSGPIYRGALDDVRIALFAVDTAGKLVLVNRAGEALIRSQQWVTVTGNDLKAANTLARAAGFKRALARLRLGAGGTVLLVNGVTGRQAVMTAVPITRQSSINMASAPVAGFLWIIPCTVETAPVRNLARLFQLTPAETLLLGQLVDGAAMRDAAAALQISVHTARTQLKAIFDKTGRRTQGQLLALANRMAMIQMGDDA